MISMIVAMTWLSNQVTRHALVPLRDSTFISAYASAAVMVYESGGKQALKQWLHTLKNTSAIDAVLIDSQGHDVLNAPLPQSVKNIVGQVVTKPYANMPYREGLSLVSAPVVSDFGQTYRLVTEMPSVFSILAQDNVPLFTLRVLIGMIITGFICYLLSIYLTKPITVLQIAAKKIGEGEFNTRVLRKMGRRKDEIADLAREFDRMTEHLEDIIKAQQRLLQDVSHELRSPLARLQVALEIARRHANGLANNEFNRIELESEKLNELIGEILSLARLQSVKEPVNDEVNVAELLQTIVNDTNFEFKDVNKSVRIIETCDCSIKANKKLLQRALENIIRNALHYTKPMTQVEIGLQRDNAGRISIKIRDHGPGVPQESLEKIFDPFYRVDGAREKSSGGYGLGLAIAKTAIKLHEGVLQARNVLGGGLLVEVLI